MNIIYTYVHLNVNSTAVIVVINILYYQSCS